MRDAFVNNSINYLIKHNACNDSNKNIFRYTLESLYSFFTKSFAVLALSLLFQTFSISLLILILYSILRGFSFGIHASKNIYCWIISITVYVVGPLLIKHFSLSLNIIYICFGIGLLALLLWAPADTPARPLLNKQKRLMNKIFSIIFSSILIFISLYIKNTNFYEIIAFILLLEAICICPITYKFFRVPYQNYKYYHK